MGQSGPPPGSHQRATPARPGRTKRTARKHVLEHALEAPEIGVGSWPHRARDRAPWPPGEHVRVDADGLGQVERGLPGVGGDAGEGVAAGERIASEPGALVAEHQRHPPRSLRRLGGERVGVHGRRPEPRVPTSPPPSCSRPPPPREGRGEPGRGEHVLGADRQRPSPCVVRVPRRANPAPLALPKFFIARAAAPRFSGVRGWTRMKRTAVGMRGRTLPPSGNERRRRGSGATGAGGSCSVAAAARGTAPAKGLG